MYLDDPEHVKEEWDEPILANTDQQARRQCRKKAHRYTEQGETNVELVDVIKASQITQKRYLCRFRS